MQGTSYLIRNGMNLPKVLPKSHEDRAWCPGNFSPSPWYGGGWKVVLVLALYLGARDSSLQANVGVQGCAPLSAHPLE